MRIRIYILLLCEVIVSCTGRSDPAPELRERTSQFVDRVRGIWMMERIDWSAEPAPYQGTRTARIRLLAIQDGGDIRLMDAMAYLAEGDSISISAEPGVAFYEGELNAATADSAKGRMRLTYRGIAIRGESIPGPWKHIVLHSKRVEGETDLLFVDGDRYTRNDLLTQETRSAVTRFRAPTGDGADEPR